MQKIIAVTGLKGSGKDTIASIICKHFTFLQQKKYIQNNSDNLTY